MFAQQANGSKACDKAKISQWYNKRSESKEGLWKKYVHWRLWPQWLTSSNQALPSHLLFFSFFLEFFSRLLSMCACLFKCMLYVWVPAEARRCQNLWNWNYKLLWDTWYRCWEPSLGPLGKLWVLTNTSSSCPSRETLPSSNPLGMNSWIDEVSTSWSNLRSTASSARD